MATRFRGWPTQLVRRSTPSSDANPVGMNVARRELTRRAHMQ
jgi:hypothetical protein